MSETTGIPEGWEVLTPGETPKPEAHIGAPDPSRAVTLGDFIDDPKGALVRAGHIVGKDLTDPKMLTAAAAAFLLPRLGAAADQAPSLPTMPKTGQALATAGRFVRHPVRSTVGAIAEELGNRLQQPAAARPEQPATSVSSASAPANTFNQAMEAWRAQQATTKTAQNPRPINLQILKQQGTSIVPVAKTSSQAIPEFAPSSLQRLSEQEAVPESVLNLLNLQAFQRLKQ